MSEYTAAVDREGDTYVARCIEVEIASQGPTPEDAVSALKEALELRFGCEVAVRHANGRT